MKKYDTKNMTNEQLRDSLDELGISHKNAKNKEELLSLFPKEEEEINSISLNDIIKKALPVKEVTEKKDNLNTEENLDYLKNKDYGLLTTGQRRIIRENSPEYADAPQGKKVKTSNRMPSGYTIIKNNLGSFYRVYPNKVYKLFDFDYEILKDETIKVKTKETENKCCGQAIWEEIKLFEVIADE